MSESNELPVKEPKNDSQETSLGKNPLDFSKEPMAKHKIFDVWYQLGSGDKTFRIYTSDGIPHIVYLYQGEDQIARVSLSEDDLEVKSIVIANKAVAMDILSSNVDFPFKDLLDQKIYGEVYGVEDKNYSFEATADELDAFEKVGMETIEKVSFITVPTALIVRIFGEKNPTQAFHTKRKIDGKLIDTSDMWNNVFGWYALNTKDWDKSKIITNQIMDPDSIVMDDSLVDTIDEKRLGYHEILHEVFSRARDENDEKAKKIVDAMMSAFYAIPVAIRKNFQQALLFSGYKPDSVPEEFWTYYLSTKTFPSEDPTEVELDILKLGESDSVKEIIEKMPFLTEDFAKEQMDIKSKNVKRLILDTDKS